MVTDIIWSCKKFSDLTSVELYAILKLRNEVFVVEQNCVFQDCDDKDQGSWHLAGMKGDVLAAYARVMPPGLAYLEASIGRVVTSPLFRQTGLGKELMRIAIKKTLELFQNPSISIGAQLYLKDFYNSLGFIQNGESYLEDGIEHIPMICNSPQTQ